MAQMHRKCLIIIQFIYLLSNFSSQMGSWEDAGIEGMNLQEKNVIIYLRT